MSAGMPSGLLQNDGWSWRLPLRRVSVPAYPRLYIGLFSHRAAILANCQIRKIVQGFQRETLDAMTNTTRLEAAIGAGLDDLKTPGVLFWAPILLGLIMLFDACDSISIAYAMPTMAAEWHLSPVLPGLMISSGYC